VLLPLLADAVDLVLPEACAGCGAPGAAAGRRGSGAAGSRSPVCPACLAALDRPPAPARPDPAPPGMPPTWAAGAYEGVLRHLLLAYKERGRHTLAGPLARLLAGAVRAACPGAGPVVLVPVPSTRAATRRRGGCHLRSLADRTACELARGGRPASVAPLLVTRARQDSAGLSAAQRAAAISGALSLRRGPPAAPGVLVVVDDVVTTGTTLCAATAALTRGSACPGTVPAAVVAATARRRPARPGRVPSTGAHQVGRPGDTRRDEG